MSTEINVLYGCDNNYAEYTGISMQSLFENNKDAFEINVYFAGINISQENVSKINSLCQQYKRNIVWLDTKTAMKKIEEFHCKEWNGSVATWIRFFVLEQIPDTVDKLLWLDSDTIVNGNIQELFDLDLGEYVCGAASDSICIGGRSRAGLKETDTYFNAGVILYNMIFWRNEDFIKGMFNHLVKNVDNYLANDQDLLNDYFKYNILKLDFKYNCQSFLNAYDTKTYLKIFGWKDNVFYDEKTINLAKEQPIIIHFFRFMGDYPWDLGWNLHPAKNLFLEWKAKSPWISETRNKKPQKIIFIIEKLLYVILPKSMFLKIFYLVIKKNS